MMNKMAARVLFYAQGLPSYGDSKGSKLKIMAKKIALPSLRLVYGNWLFGYGKEWYHFQQELMVSKMLL